MTVSVTTGHGGSRCVISQGDTYIEDRIDVRYPGISFIEVVRYGQRIHSDVVLTRLVPKVMIKYMKRYLRCPKRNS